MSSRSQNGLTPFQKIERSMASKWKESNRGSFELVAQRIHELLVQYPIGGREAISQEETFNALWDFVVEHEQLGLLSDIMLRRVDLYSSLDPKAKNIGSAEEFSAKWLSKIPPPPAATAWAFDLLRPELAEGFEEYTLVHIGCGLGNAMASAIRHPFAAIIGVESDDKTAETCRTNMDMARSRSFAACMEVLVMQHKSLANYEFSGGTPTILFMHGPCSGMSTDECKSTMQAIMQRARGKVEYVIYVERKEKQFEAPALKAIESTGFSRLHSGVRRHVTGTVPMHLYRARTSTIAVTRSGSAKSVGSMSRRANSSSMSKLPVGMR